MKREDRVFDGLAAKFSANIYKTSKGQLRQTLLEEALTPWLMQQPLRVIDIGGGTGVMSAFLSEKGGYVVMTDASGDVLEEASCLLGHRENVVLRQQRIQDIPDLCHYDIVVCHAVLEWLSSPFDVLADLYRQMRSGALLSLSFFNSDAALFGNAVYGNFDFIDKGLSVKNRVQLNTHTPLPPQLVLDECQSIGFDLHSCRGIRCFHDYLKDKHKQIDEYPALLELERKYHQQAPFMWLGRYFHMFLLKP